MLTDLLQLPLRDHAVYDELSADGVTPRPHWSAFVNTLHRMSPEELSERWDRADQRMHDNGVTYNMYGGPEGVNRRWRADLIPLLIDAAEWRQVEAGIIQYAELLELILNDLYGPQTLLSRGLLPPELVFANPAYLRPLANVLQPKQPYLHMIGIDLARSPDGQWWVVAHRTQAPSGAGYALENRMTIADVLPELFLNENVERLAGFFRARQDALTQLAGRDDAQIVMMTPGPFNETYFEHAYLARYLGLSLVQGSDLTVRDSVVYLKTVHGLKRVDVIVRRVDDSFCDPLELRSDSLLGVSGLVEASLAGNVKIANALGSGVIETAALLPFLPGLSRALLGETLRMPSVATWWCGQDYALDWVLDHLDNLVIKTAFPARTHAMEPVFGAELSAHEKAKLAARLRARSYDYVAQERVALSKAPVWDEGHLYSRSLMLRSFVVNTGAGWKAMPGGLVRVAAENSNVVSMQRGGHSKDAWILRDSPVDTTITLLAPASAPIELRRSSKDLPSRVADNLFWLGRYVERAENTARLLRTSLSRVRRADRTELRSLARLNRCFDTHHSTLTTTRTPTANALETELLSLMSDADRPDSLAAILEEVRRVGGNLRERLSADMTRLVGQLGEATQVEEYMLFSEHRALLSGCLELLSAFSGLERENLTRGPGWLFLSLGRRLERAVYTVRFLRQIAALRDPEEWPLLEQLLEVADSSITYRTRYFTLMHPVAVLDVLMLDETNPRSLEFQLSHLVELYEKLPRHMEDDARTIDKVLSRMAMLELTKVQYALPVSADSPDGVDERRSLQQLLEELEAMLPVWSDNLASTYFSHVQTLPIAIGQ